MKRISLAVLFLLAAVARGQTNAALSGVVTDPSGGAIANSDLILVNTETNAKRTAQVDAQGRYSFSQVTPGTYQLKASAAGFSVTVINGISLLVNTSITLDVHLELAGVQQAVAVSADTSEVNTQDATLGNAIGTHPIMELPFDARNVVGLLSIQPGVTFFADPSQRDDYRSGSVNGGKSDQGNVTLDGVDVNNQQNRTAFTSVLRSTLDSVQEFRTTTTNGDADSGHTSGAQVALVTKSGTNALHGSFYEFTRNTLTSANSFFNNAAGVPRQKLIRNVFGTSLGGPIKKNRLFYFLNYEGRRDASQATVVRTVPNAAFRQGIFSYKNTANQLEQLTPAQVAALDPAGIGESAAVLKTLQSYPMPNDTTVGDGVNTAGYRFNSAVPLSQSTYIARIDYQIDSAGKHTLFARGNLQNDHSVPSTGLPQFPGQSDASVTLENDKGVAIGYTWLISPNKVSTFRYGFTRQSFDNTGLQTGPVVSLNNITDPVASTKPLTAKIPVHDLEENLTWTHGGHTFTFGGSVHFIRTRRLSYASSFSSAQATPGWFSDNARFLLLSDVNSKSASAFTQQMVNLLGLVSQGTGDYNYSKAGAILPQGQGISRDFGDDEYEFYVQDSWRMSRGLTITAGAHVSFLPPLWEVNGYQTSTNMALSDWLDERGALAAQGKPQSDAPQLSYNLAGAPGGSPLYPTQRHVAPRLGVAYSPQTSTGWLSHVTGGPGKTSIRAGFGIYYDLFGQSLIRIADATALGFSTQLRNPGTETSATVPRYISPTQIPAGLLPAAPAGGFPQTAPDVFATASGLDRNLNGPYSMNVDFALGRDLPHGFHLEASYVGRFSRHSLIGEDVGMYTDLVDPTSHQSYFQAANAMQNYVIAKAPVGSVPSIPFFEDIFPGYAGGGKTATQNIYQKYWSTNPNSDTTALQMIDASATGCSPCSIFGPNALYSPQYAALTAFRTAGDGDYNALQVTVRKRFSNGVQFDLNYTFSKSIDMNSTRETDGPSTKQILNPWSPSEMRALSDYDVTHLVSAFMVAELPFGRGKHFASHANAFVNGVIGGWQLSGIWRQSSGLPVSVSNGGYWPTNWNAAGYATQVSQFQDGTTKNSPIGGANIFPNPATAFSAFSLTMAGQVGSRNVVRGDGYFTIDTGLSKRFRMFYNEHHSIQIRAEAFNVTNSVRFDVNQLSISLSNPGAFGKYSGTLNTPRVMQFGARYDF